MITPTKAEMVAIVNPTSAIVDLSDYYITDAVDTSSNKYYYNLPSGSDYWSGSALDFIARFPENATIGSGDTLFLSLHTKEMFEEVYPFSPDLSLFEDMRDDEISYDFLDLLNDQRGVLILFQWDGSTELVRDVDYFLWGDNSNSIDKTDVEGYNPDTPIEEQSFIYAHGEDSTYVRISAEEIGEKSTGGNGITGHDETSENRSAQDAR